MLGLINDHYRIMCMYIYHGNPTRSFVDNNQWSSRLKIGHYIVGHSYYMTFKLSYISMLRCWLKVEVCLLFVILMHGCINNAYFFFTTGYFIYSIPSRYEAFWKELDGFKNVLKTTRELNVEKAGIVALFGVECFAWFWTGEVVGRGGTITGYYVWVELL